MPTAGPTPWTWLRIRTDTPPADWTTAVARTSIGDRSMGVIRSRLTVVALLAALGQVVSASAGFVGGLAHSGEVHAINCICEPGEHSPLCPMHRHLVGTHAGTVTTGDASCQVTATTMALPSAFGSPALPEQAFQSESPTGSAPLVAIAPRLYTRLGSVDSPPPRT